MKKVKYLITGCAGFVGTNLVKNLYKKYNLILVDDLSEGNIKNLPKPLRRKLIKKKIQDVKKLNIKNLSGIFHLAAQASVPFSLKNFYNSTSNNLLSSIKVFEISKNILHQSCMLRLRLYMAIYLLVVIKKINFQYFRLMLKIN